MKKQRKTRRTGFTLIELLVVITIIGMLVSLLLPAVQAAREAGRRLTCQNNLKQLYTATQGYDTAQGQLPGYQHAIGAGATLADKSIVSWHVMLFPYMEQQILYDPFRDSTTPIVEGDPQYNYYLEILTCPTNPPENRGGPANAYVANGGKYVQPSTGSSTGRNNDVPSYSGSRADGVFTDRVNDEININLGFISSPGDGTEQTIMFAENVQAGRWEQYSPEKKYLVALWHDTNTPNATMRVNGLVKTAVLDSSSNSDACRPSAFHPGVANVAYCGGAIMALNENVEYRVYQQLMISQDRESTHSDAANLTPLSSTDYRNN